MEIKLWVLIPCAILLFIIVVSRIILKIEARTKMTKELEEMGFLRGYYRNLPIFSNPHTHEVYGRGYYSELLVSIMIYVDIHVIRIDGFLIWTEGTDEEIKEAIYKSMEYNRKQIKDVNSPSA